MRSPSGCGSQLQQLHAVPYQPTLNFSPLSKSWRVVTPFSAELVQLTQFSLPQPFAAPGKDKSML